MLRQHGPCMGIYCFPSTLFSNIYRVRHGMIQGSQGRGSCSVHVEVVIRIQGLALKARLLDLRDLRS